MQHVRSPSPFFGHALAFAYLFRFIYLFMVHSIVINLIYLIEFISRSICFDAIRFDILRNTTWSNKLV